MRPALTFIENFGRYRQTFSSFFTAPRKYGSTPTRLHTFAKTVFVASFPFRRLIGPFHLFGCFRFDYAPAKVRFFFQQKK